MSASEQDVRPTLDVDTSIFANCTEATVLQQDSCTSGAHAQTRPGTLPDGAVRLGPKCQVIGCQIGRQAISALRPYSNLHGDPALVPSLTPGERALRTPLLQHLGLPRSRPGRGATDTVTANGRETAECERSEPRVVLYMQSSIWLRINETAYACNISRDTVMRRLRSGAFPRSRRVAGSDGKPTGPWLIPLDDIVAADLKPDSAKLDLAVRQGPIESHDPRDKPPIREASTDPSTSTQTRDPGADLVHARAKAEFLAAENERLWSLLRLVVSDLVSIRPEVVAPVTSSGDIDE